jgi:hypothetical protein
VARRRHRQIDARTRARAVFVLVTDGDGDEKGPSYRCVEAHTSWAYQILTMSRRTDSLVTLGENMGYERVDCIQKGRVQIRAGRVGRPLRQPGPRIRLSGSNNRSMEPTVHMSAGVSSSFQSERVVLEYCKISTKEQCTEVTLRRNFLRCHATKYPRKTPTQAPTGSTGQGTGIVTGDQATSCICFSELRLSASSSSG